MTTTNTKTCRQLLTELAPGKSLVMLDPKQPGKVVTQASRVGDIYYLTGPLFNDWMGNELVLEPFFEVALSAQDTEANAVSLANRYLLDHGAPAEARIFICHNLPDALSTVAELFADY